VASYHELQPLANAHVRVIGAAKATETDSVGRYQVSLPKPGSYVVRASKEGYVDQTMTVQVPDSAVEAVILLDSGTAASIPEALLQEYDERLRWQSNGAALVSGSNLRHYKGSTTEALSGATKVIRRGLRLTGEICLFVDGIPRPYLPIDAIPVEAIENVELYTARGEVTSTLMHAWPPGTQCGDGRTKTTAKVGEASDAGAVRYVAIWLRR
jgi:hypothetical protein